MTTIARPPLEPGPEPGHSMRDWVEIERCVSAFESARVTGPKRLADFLPRHHPRLHLPTLLELVRVDLELGISRGEPRRIEQYRAEHPQLFNDPELLSTLAFEEWRCRSEAGDAVDPSEYARQYGIDTSAWPASFGRSAERSGPFELPRPHEVPSEREIAGWFDDFRIETTLGVGSFARVVLATQPQLADRKVVLKVSYHLHREAERIARLQHTNIVPVYATSTRGGMQAIVMPFFGGRTLARELADVEQGFSVDRVLKIGAALAEGLAHAHERAVLHLDLKPANILLAETGEPMLLDFNLSSHGNEPAELLGGSPAYLEPDLLSRDAPVLPDERTDVYALGVVLLEMLVGRYPWPRHSRGGIDRFERLRADRMDVRMLAGSFPPGVPSAVRNIVFHCLHPRRDSRYASASQLAEDLRRQRSDRPLRYAPDRSVKERAGKFVRRNRWVVSMGAVATLATMVVVGSSLAIYARGRQLARSDALGAIARFEQEATHSRLALSVPDPTARDVEAAVASAEKLLQSIGADTELRAPAWRYLDDAERRQRLRAAAAELSLLVARGHRILAREAEAPRPLLERALIANALAEKLQGGTSRAVMLQRATLMLMSGDEDLAAQLVREAGALSPVTAREYYLLGLEAAARREVLQSVALLRRAVELDGTDPTVWFLLARCHGEAGDATAALRAAQAAAVLAPGSAVLQHELGRWLAECGDPVAAEQAYGTAIGLEPAHAPTFVDRCLVRLRQGKHDAALEDARRALQLDPSITRAHFIEARLLSARRDSSGAAEAMRLGLEREPGDEQSWIARGVARIELDPRAALSDFEAALKLNPSSADALQNKAHVLAERLADHRAALLAMEQLVALRPEDAEVRAATGVLKARLGMTEALSDAEAVLQMSVSNAVAKYQAACIHALLVPSGAGSTERAFELLADALGEGFGAEELDQDEDLAAIRTDPRFTVLQQFARLRGEGRSVRPR